MKMRYLFLITLFTFCTSLINAQNSISGSVIDKDNKEPIFGATVFIGNTTLKTLTDKAGNYEITGLPPGYNKIVVNKIGFKSYSGNAISNRVMNIQLRPDALQMIPVKADKKQDKKRKRLYNQFEKAFLGISANAKQSKILNPWVIKLDKASNGSISAYSIDLIQIENKRTGYIINYLLDKAEVQNRQITYSGKALFTALETEDDAERARWAKNRESTFLGSQPHFLMSLANNQLEEEGFEVYRVKYDNKTNVFTIKNRLNQADVFSNKALKFDDFLGIIYNKEPAESAYINEHRTVTSMPDDGINQVTRGSYATFDGPDNQLQESFLFNRASKISINEFGEPKNPEYLLKYGYWSWERAADLMPKTYRIK